ncbi:hypothetical protein BDA99DRAFT_35867 [Phascolomyces articulosus]|uniref:Uncharacterized protein n=1 Tax=Phascolomyces articulosus TaxID=60185 RepID=A0AAD5KCK0_9FUNG|nr:hypothetical protein BDA99DRAFT_35867 [Phascolomyces articulosus]
MTTTPISRMLYPYPWDLAVRANQQRYPTHELVPILKRSEILLDETYFSQHDLDSINSICSNDQQQQAMVFEPYHQGQDQDQELFPDGRAPKHLEQHPELLPPSDTVAVVVFVNNITKSKCNDDHPTLENIIPQVGVRRIVRRVYLQTPKAAQTALRMNEMIIRHESWIDPKRRELRIVTWNETWANTALVGDVTVYRGISDPSDWRGKVPVAPMVEKTARGKDHPPHFLFVGPILQKNNHDQTITTSLSSPTNVSQQQPKDTIEWCLFLQYAYFKISPTLRIPFRSMIETKCLKCYHHNTQEGRKLDMEFMQQQQDN